MRTKSDLINLIEFIQVTFVALYISLGLQWVSDPFWTMVESGLESEIRWPGIALLLAIILNLLGLFILRYTLPPCRTHYSGIRLLIQSYSHFILMGSRWLATLMLMILGLLGLGIDARGVPEPAIVALILLVPSLQEFLIYLPTQRSCACP